MSKKEVRLIYVCSECGGEHLRWSGKCNLCGGWNTLKEMTQIEHELPSQESRSIRLSDVKISDKNRISTGIEEFDMVLGGGIVPGSVILLGGHPGIGKSTLVWQVACNMKGKVAYVGAEESPEQIKIRASRLGDRFQNIIIYDNQDIAHLKSSIQKENLALLIVDSIQTVFDSRLNGSPGSLMQVKNAALEFISLAKKYSIPTILIGHVTKEGEVAGPKTLEHLVDAVFYLDGQGMSNERFLRSSKNRFGPTDELGVFRLTDKGLKSASDFGRLEPKGELPDGVVRTAVNEGSRVYFLEVQALVQKAGYGFAKRNAVGFDLNRLQMIIAILSRHTKVNLNDFDVFLNIADGYRLKDPIADMAVLFALAGSYYQKPIDGKNIAIGEVDLAGRIHLPESAKKIVKTAKKMNYLAAPFYKYSLKEAIQKVFESSSKAS